MKKKNIIIIVSIISVIVLLSIVTIYKMIKEKPVIDTEKPDLESLIDEDTYTKLVNYYGNFGNCNTGKVFDFNEKPEYTINDFDEATVYSLAFNYLRYNNLVVSKGNGVDVPSFGFNKTDLEKAIVELFGSTFSEVLPMRNTIQIGNDDYHLNNGVYSGLRPNNLCLNTKNEAYTPISFGTFGNEIQLKFVVYYEETNTDFVTNIYKYREDNTPLTTKENITEHYDELDKYIYIFVPEGNNIILKSIVKEEE